jgi:hypothetical protein
MAICAFYKHRRNLMRLIPGHNGGQYLRLMAISTTEILGTVPLWTFDMVSDAKLGIIPWKGWASMHSHYSEVNQVAGVTWKSVPELALALEMDRWEIVAFAFVFFALYGFSAEAREQYYRLYKRISTLSSPSVPHGTPHAYVVRSPCFSVIHWGSLFMVYRTSSEPHVRRNGGPNMVQAGRDKDHSSVSLTLTDQPSVLSISV